jgi:hypothetical protein
MATREQFDRSRAVARILKDFDFENVHACMQAMCWKWGTQIPSVHTLHAQARELLESLIADPDTLEIEVGGFRATREFQTGHEELRLSFVIDTSATFTDTWKATDAQHATVVRLRSSTSRA